MKKEFIFKIVEFSITTLLTIGSIYASIKSSKMSDEHLEDISNRVANKLYDKIQHAED